MSRCLAFLTLFVLLPGVAQGQSAAELVQRLAGKPRCRTSENAAIAVALTIATVGVVLYRRRVAVGRAAQRLSMTDTLTGLKNRRYMLETIAADLAVSERKYFAVTAERNWHHDLMP